MMFFFWFELTWEGKWEIKIANSTKQRSLR